MGGQLIIGYISPHGGHIINVTSHSTQLQSTKSPGSLCFVLCLSFTGIPASTGNRAGRKSGTNGVHDLVAERQSPWALQIQYAFQVQPPLIAGGIQVLRITSFNINFKAFGPHGSCTYHHQRLHSQPTGLNNEPLPRRATQQLQLTLRHNSIHTVAPPH